MDSSVAIFCSFADVMNRKGLCSCLAKKGNSLCNRVLSRKNQDLVESYLAKIASSAVPVSEFFGILAQAAFCGSHIKNLNAAHAGNQWYEEWKSMGNAAKQENEVPTERHHQSLSVSTSRSQASFCELDEDSTLISSPSSPMRYGPMASGRSEEDRAKRVTRVLEQVPKEGDSREGVVYILSIDDSPGLYKIGYTENGIDARKVSHKQCHGSLTSVISEPTKWACRIEKLVHADLCRFQLRQIKKCQCGVQHRELFRVDREEIWRSLLKWTRFFLQYPNPYNKDGALKEGVKLPSPAFRREYLSSTPTKKGQENYSQAMAVGSEDSTTDEDEDENQKEDDRIPNRRKSGRQTISQFSLNFTGNFSQLRIED